MVIVKLECILTRNLPMRDVFLWKLVPIEYSPLTANPTITGLVSTGHERSKKKKREREEGRKRKKEKNKKEKREKGKKEESVPRQLIREWIIWHRRKSPSLARPQHAVLRSEVRNSGSRLSLFLIKTQHFIREPSGLGSRSNHSTTVPCLSRYKPQPSKWRRAACLNCWCYSNSPAVC